MILFWDIDGTLLYCGSDGTMALNATFFELYGLEDAFHQVGIGSAMDSVILEKIMDKFHIPISDLNCIKEKFNDKLEDILKKSNEKKVLPGIRELLYYAEGEGHINSLLTSNMKSGAEIKLKSVNLKGHFLGGGFGDEKGEKWDIAFHAKMKIEELTGRQFNANEVVIIGDSVYDIKTARLLGYRMISVATGWTPKDKLEKENPDVLFDNFEDVDSVKNVLKKWATGDSEN